MVSATYRHHQRGRSGSSLTLGHWLVILLAATLVLLVVLPPGLVLILRAMPPPTTSFMLRSEIKPVRYQWVPKERIAGVAREAVVASEDQKFWTHRGFDLEAIQKAYEKNQKGRKQRGGSTISQQTAKNLFLWQGGGYFRKGVEAYLTVLIEHFWPKERILEVYLNIAEFGPGIYGVEAASQQFFAKHAANLSAAEAARLAAVLPRPKRWNAAAPGPYVQKRAGWILRQMGRAERGIKPSEEPPPLPPEERPAARKPVLPPERPMPAGPETAPAEQVEPTTTAPQESPEVFEPEPAEPVTGPEAEPMSEEPAEAGESTTEGPLQRDPHPQLMQ